jgi:ferredoxin-NADP reductase
MSEEMKRFELTLINNEQVGVDYFIFNFEMPKDLNYKEGQYGAFKHVGKEIDGRKVRALSFASTTDEDILKIATVITDTPSDFKAKMLKLKKGDKMTVDGPLGAFTLEEDKNAIFFAAGIGITAVRGMARKLEELDNGKENVLIHAEHREFYCFKEDFKDFNNVLVKYENTGANMKDRAAIMARKYKNDAVYYVAGNPGFVTAVATIIQGQGVDPKQIKFEKFTGY